MQINELHFKSSLNISLIFLTKDIKFCGCDKLEKFNIDDLRKQLTIKNKIDCYGSFNGPSFIDMDEIIY